MKQVFDAIALVSRGRFGVVYEANEQGTNDYYINLEFHSDDNSTIIMPPVLQDCMRDIVANARKYSKPGSRIDVHLNNDNNITLLVRDSGRGIPDKDLEYVADYGFRASNVGDKETMGGGFGLTKAALLCQRYDGQMWIESEVGKGTIVTLQIPGPEHVTISH